MKLNFNTFTTINMSYNKISNTIGPTNVQHTNEMLNPQVKQKAWSIV